MIPKCPVCGYVLEGVPKPLPKKGRGYCAAGGGWMEFSIDPDEFKYIKTKDGDIQKVPRLRYSESDHDKPY